MHIQTLAILILQDMENQEEFQFNEQNFHFINLLLLELESTDMAEGHLLATKFMILMKEICGNRFDYSTGFALQQEFLKLMSPIKSGLMGKDE